MRMTPFQLVEVIAVSWQFRDEGVVPLYCLHAFYYENRPFQTTLEVCALAGSSCEEALIFPYSTRLGMDLQIGVWLCE